MENSSNFVDFDSLPYPLSDNDSEVISMYKQKAVKREEEILARRLKRNNDLLIYVATRLKEWGDRKKVVTRQQLQATPITTPPHSSTQHSLNKPYPYHHTQYKMDPVKPVSVTSIPIRSPPKPVSITSIPIRSPPKPTIKRGSNDFHHGHGGRGQTVLPVATDSSIPRHSYNHSPMYHYTPTVRTRSDSVYFVSAVIKGYLTRRLLNSEKIQDIVTTVKDAELVLQSLVSPSTMQEFDLQQRIINQLHTAKLKLHHIFFELSSRDKMAYIAHSRNLRKERQLKKLELQEMKRTRLSTATLKSMERKKKQSILPTPTAPSKNPVTTAKKAEHKPSSKPIAINKSSSKTTVKGETSSGKTTTSNRRDKLKLSLMEKKTTKPASLMAGQSTSDGKSVTTSSKNTPGPSKIPAPRSTTTSAGRKSLYIKPKPR